jgi:hypothetical protein
LKEIPLGKSGYTALVSDDDYDRLMAMGNWGYNVSDGYARSSKKIPGTNRHYKMHRVVMNATDPDVKINHWDHNKLNNQRSNLDPMTQTENTWHRNPATYGGVSRYPGVCYRNGEQRKKPWHAKISYTQPGCKPVNVHIGYYTTEIAAAMAYERNARMIRGNIGCWFFNQADLDYIPLKDLTNVRSRKK